MGAASGCCGNAVVIALKTGHFGRVFLLDLTGSFQPHCERSVERSGCSEEGVSCSLGVADESLVSHR